MGIRILNDDSHAGVDPAAEPTAESEGQGSGKGMRRRSYTGKRKADVIAELESVYHGNKRACAKAHHITPKMLRYWMSQVPVLQSLEKHRLTRVRRVRHVVDTASESKRRGKFPELDSAVFAWIQQRRKERLTVSYASIQAKARELAAVMDGVTQFRAWNGWLHNFIARFNLLNPS